VQFQDRSAKRCRDRYLNKLDPALTTSAWTEDEDRKIVAAQARLGNRSLQAPYPVRSCSGTVVTESQTLNRWQEMSKRLDGRSERAVKDRWLSVLQHKADEIMMMLTGNIEKRTHAPSCTTRPLSLQIVSPPVLFSNPLSVCSCLDD